MEPFAAMASDVALLDLAPVGFRPSALDGRTFGPERPSVIEPKRLARAGHEDPPAAPSGRYNHRECPGYVYI